MTSCLLSSMCAWPSQCRHEPTHVSACSSSHVPAILWVSHFYECHPNVKKKKWNFYNMASKCKPRFHLGIRQGNGISVPKLEEKLVVLNSLKRQQRQMWCLPRDFQRYSCLYPISYSHEKCESHLSGLGSAKTLTLDTCQNITHYKLVSPEFSYNLSKTKKPFWTGYSVLMG